MSAPDLRSVMTLYAISRRLAASSSLRRAPMRLSARAAARPAEFERAMIRERTSAGTARARAEGRIGGRRKKLDATKRHEIAESIITGRKLGVDRGRLYNISQPTVSRIVAQHRTIQSGDIVYG
jgi:DNA invertase Pin-like site-specific DNA recombinase